MNVILFMAFYNYRIEQDFKRYQLETYAIHFV